MNAKIKPKKPISSTTWGITTSKQMPPMTTREKPSNSSLMAADRSPRMVHRGPTKSAKDAAKTSTTLTVSIHRQRRKSSLRHNLLHGSGEPLGC